MKNFLGNICPKKKIGYWHNLNYQKLVKERKVSINNSEKIKFIKNLNKLGYSKNYKIKKNTYIKVLTSAFQRRFRQEMVNGIIDKECLIISQNL